MNNLKELKALLDYEVLGTDLWFLVGLPIAIMLSVIIAHAAAGLISIVVKKLLSFTRLKSDKSTHADLLSPSRLLFAIFLFKLFKNFLKLSPEVIDLIHGIEITLIIFTVVWFSFIITDGFIDYGAKALKKSKNYLGISALPLLRRTIKIIIALIGILALLQNYGVNVGAIIAGLGIGGLAFALAAQKTIENLFGGIVLILDQPFKPGDFCKIREHVGNIEEIGLRSTTIRSQNRTLITIPNSELSQAVIENYAVRDKILLQNNILISSLNSSDNIERAIDEINSHLHSLEIADRETCRARITSFGEYYLAVEIFAYILETDFGKFTVIRDKIFLDILRIFEKHNCILATPADMVIRGIKPEITAN